MLLDSIVRTNIPVLRKPFSKNLPPKVPIVDADDMGGEVVAEVDGDAVNGIQGVYVEGRVIKPLDGDLGGYDADGGLKCIYIKGGKFVESGVIETLRVEPVGIGTVPVAKITLPSGEEFYINAPAGGSGGGSVGGGGSGNMPNLAPVWLDYINSGSNCVPVEDSGENLLQYAGAYRYQFYASGGVKLSVNVLSNTKPASNSYFELVSQSGYTSTYKVLKAGRYLITSSSGRVSHSSTSMTLTITCNGTAISHNCPAGQKYVYSNPVVYDLNVGDTIYSTGSHGKYTGTGSYTVEPCPLTDKDLYIQSGSEYVKATSYDTNGTLADGVNYYIYNGTSVSGKSVAYPDTYEHLLADYNAVVSAGASTDTYTLSDGSTVSIPYYKAGDQHKICIYDSTILSKLKQLYDDPSIGEAWYYVLRGGSNESFWLPRTRHGFHGSRGYAKIPNTAVRMYLHFMVS